MRGRPRKDPDRLATWKAPKGWGRIVVWASADERKALKRMAVEADTTVAQLIRTLATGLHHGEIGDEEILSPFRKGKAVMEKIPTIFERGPDFKVLNRPRPNCDWVFAGEGKATEKLDGTNIRLTLRAGTVVRVEKRKNPTKTQKERGIVDGWYLDADEYAKEDKHIFDAVRSTDVHEWPDGEHPAEALGPHIQGNPLALEKHLCVPFNLWVPVYEGVPRNFDELREFLAGLDSKYAPGHKAEGIVFHHPDGRRAKIKRKDFAK